MGRDHLAALRLSDVHRNGVEKGIFDAIKQHADGATEGMGARKWAFEIDWNAQGVAVRTVDTGRLSDFMQGMMLASAGLRDEPNDDIGPMSNRLELSWRQAIGVVRSSLEVKQRDPIHVAVMRYKDADRAIAAWDEDLARAEDQLRDLPPPPEKRLLRRRPDPHRETRGRLHGARLEALDGRYAESRARDDAYYWLKDRGARDRSTVARVDAVEEDVRDLAAAEMRIGTMEHRRERELARGLESPDVGPSLDL